MNPCSRLFVCLLFAVAIASKAEPDAKFLRFEFRDRNLKGFLLETNAISKFFAGEGKNSWIKGRSEAHPDQEIEISSRVAMQIEPSQNIIAVLAGSTLDLLEQFNDTTYILQASDAWMAAQEAQRLSHLPGVTASTPVMRHLNLQAQAAYAYKPNDTHWTNEWHLENRNTNGATIGADINARSAWPVSLGTNVIIGIADDGIELSHPDLSSRVSTAQNYNFVTPGTNLQLAPGDKHGTPVAGLAVAALNNSTGVAGVAPSAKFANWRIINNNLAVAASADQLGNMFRYASNVVAVQNHSWGSFSLSHYEPGFLEKAGIDAAINLGRNGRGVVMVRSVPDKRSSFGDANDDGYPSDPRIIAVGATLSNGRVASYSDTGANILVAAPGGEFGFNTLFTTDRLGTNGYNTAANGDYSMVNGQGQAGTSFAAPQIAGIAALLLSVNTNLSYRDVQQILIHSARQVDLADPDIRTNNAGFRVSHNVGFGIPDAGVAVRLAKKWTNRPARTQVVRTTNFTATIPDDGLRVTITNTAVPVSLRSIPASPSVGPHPDSATAFLPLVDVGRATNVLTTNLTGKAALILRGGGTFFQKITNVANAGAAFAIIYDDTNSAAPLRPIMTGTDFVPIPAVSINNSNGVGLHNFLLTNSTTVQLKVLTANYVFSVTNKLLCEHVGVRVVTDNLRRADVRITLLSPRGTRSILQHVNNDPSTNAVIDWTYTTTHHFYESTATNWTVAFSDQATGATGVVHTVELQLYGVPITDTDNDGLDDNWERSHFTNSLAQGPKADLDKDGYNNAREQILGTNPNLADPLQLDFSKWDNRLARISWPANTNYTYDVSTSGNLPTYTVATNIVGQFPEMDWFTPYTASNKFIRIIGNPR